MLVKINFIIVIFVLIYIRFKVMYYNYLECANFIYLTLKYILINLLFIYKPYQINYKSLYMFFS